MCADASDVGIDASIVMAMPISAIVSIGGLSDLSPRQTVNATITYADGSEKTIPLLVRIDTEDEMEYYRNGGILHYVLRNLVSAEQAA